MNDILLGPFFNTPAVHFAAVCLTVINYGYRLLRSNIIPKSERDKLN